MRVEALSIKAVTIGIFLMIGAIAIILSLMAGSYFKQSALDAQMKSLSRVIEVATQEVLKDLSNYTFDLGMKLAHSPELIQSLAHIDRPARRELATTLLDDPFVSGFVGFPHIDLEKIRIYDTERVFLVESTRGIEGLEREMPRILAQEVAQRHGIDRLRSIDALWMSDMGPLYSTLVPIGGLRLVGYLEIVTNPAFNLPEIGKITRTPVSAFPLQDSPLKGSNPDSIQGYLPVEYQLLTSDGMPAFRIVGYEDVDALTREMERTQLVTTGGFLLMSLGTLAFALWLFKRFLFNPLERMILDIKQMAHGKLDIQVNEQGLSEFSILARAFNSMAEEVRDRTRALEQLSMQDGLTGIANRRKFDLDFLREWKRALRDGGELSLLMIDIDHFKAYNDNYGHLAGDECLRKVALAIDCSVNRPDDLAARFGGEEFIVLLPGTRADALRGIADKCLQAIAMASIPFAQSPRDSYLTVSIGGVCISAKPDIKPADVIQMLAKALARAKHEGRNRHALEHHKQ